MNTESRYTDYVTLSISLINPCGEISSTELTGTNFYYHGQSTLLVEFTEFSVPDVSICGDFEYSVISPLYDQEIFSFVPDSSAIEIDISSIETR